MIELYRNFIDEKVDAIVNALDGQVTPPPQNTELYRDFLDRKFGDIMTALDGVVKLKKFTYKGTGTPINDITFPTKPDLILLIDGFYSSSANIKLFNTPYGVETGTTEVYYYGEWTTSAPRGVKMSYSDNIVTIYQSSSTYIERVLNVLDKTYTVYYI